MAGMRKSRRPVRAPAHVEMIDRLEALHLMIIQAEAYQHACEETYRRLVLQCEIHEDSRRDINRIDCYFEQANDSFSKLLAESGAVIHAMTVRHAR